MKKLLIGAALVLGLVAAYSQNMQNFVARDLLAGNQAVFLTNNTTTSYGDVGVPYTNASGAAVYSLTNSYSTNGLTAPGTLYTNQYLYYPAAWQDVPSFSNNNGDNASASLAISLIGTTASTTGAMTFTFVQMLGKNSSGLNTPATATNNKFIIAITPTGTTLLSMSTNLPTAQMQGSAGWRLSSIVEPNNAAAGGVMVKSITLNGFQP